MVVLTDDIKFFLSGGAANTNPLNSKGGAISSSQILQDAFNTIFDDITSSQNAAGSLEHRCIYVKNGSASTLRAARVYFGVVDNHTGVGLTSRDPGVTEDSIPKDEAIPGAGNDDITVGPIAAPTEWRRIFGWQTNTNLYRLDENNARAGVYIHTVSSALYLQRIDRAEVWLSKTGTPTGTLTVKIRNLQTGGDKPTLGTLDVSTLTGTMTKKPFIMDNSVKYTPEVGDVVSVEYNGSGGNYVNVGLELAPVTGVRTGRYVVAYPGFSGFWTRPNSNNNGWAGINVSGQPADATNATELQCELYTSVCGLQSSGGGGSNQPEQPGAPEDPGPPPITFTGFKKPTKFNDGLLLGDIPASSWKGIWLERNCEQNRNPDSDIPFQIIVKGGNA